MQSILEKGLVDFDPNRLHFDGLVDDARRIANNRSMNRVLLVIDDYSELVYLETLLKKVGFDVDGIQNNRKFDEKRLTLNPEVVIASAKGKNVNGLSLVEKMKRRGGKPRNILIIPQILADKLKGLKLKNVDGTLNAPVQPEPLLTLLADLTGQDATQLLEKYERAKVSLDPDNDKDVQMLRRDASEDRQVIKSSKNKSEGDSVEVIKGDGPEPSREHISGAGRQVNFEKTSTLSDDERNQRMQAMLDSMQTPEHDGFPKDYVSQQHRKLRAEEDEDRLHDLEEERRAFVRSMFKKQNG